MGIRPIPSPAVRGPVLAGLLAAPLLEIAATRADVMEGRGLR